jgi:hypothetical protein
MIPYRPRNAAVASVHGELLLRRARRDRGRDQKELGTVTSERRTQSENLETSSSF